jgi:TetR/AcrR family transcriptional repressor of nem operon
VRGYQAASLPELLKTMGISRQSPDGSVGSRRDSYIRAIEHYHDHQLSQALALLEGEGSPLGNVRSVVRFFEKLAAEVPCQSSLVASALVEMCPHDAVIAKLLNETLELLREAVERSLQDAQARGELAAGKSPRYLSRALTNAMIGLTVTGYTGTLSLLD